MTPSERLKEIEREWKMGSLSTKDSSWLIIRVKRLTEAHQRIIQHAPRISEDVVAVKDYVLAIARKALEEE